MTSAFARAPDGEVPSRVGRGAWIGLAAILVGFLAARLPFVLEQLPGQDELFFSVPGLMVARGEVPRIPYYPARNPEAFFYRADEILLEMPPALFYVQAPAFWIGPASVATARLPSLIAGMASIVFVFLLGRRAGDGSTGLWGAGFYAASRVLFFPATFARPDQCCAACGLAAILALWTAIDSGRKRRFLLPGVLLGAGLLFHPFAITYCLLAGLWTLVARASIRERLMRAVILTATTVAIFALWLPLIARAPDIFKKQFFNTMSLTGPNLLTRLAWPWPSVGNQVRLLSELAGEWQFWLMAGGLVVVTLLAAAARERKLLRLVAITWSAMYLLTACQGMHPTKGYWTFTGALVFACLGTLPALLTRRLAGRVRLVSICAAGLGLLLFFLPQSGLRMWQRHVFPDPEGRYDGREFLSRLMNEIPRGGRYVVEPAFVFDVWLSGRDAIARLEEQDYLVDHYRYDWLLVSRDGLDKSIPKRLHGRLVRTFGDKDDLLACYAELYEPADDEYRATSP